MERRKFIKQTSAGLGSLMVGSSVAHGNSMFNENRLQKMQTIPISKTEKPLAIAMWDFSWILRHHRYGEFENWDKVLEELAERGYNAIRIDAMPHFVAAESDGTIVEEFRSVKDGWQPPLWGNYFTMSFRPREALLEFLPKCRKYGIKVGLSTWFSRHGTSRHDIFFDEGGLLRAWNETLSFLKENSMLDNVIYVDILNEYPAWHGFDWFKNELNKRSDIEQFKLNNPEANIQEFEGRTGYNQLQIEFCNDFINQTIITLKQEYPDIDFFASLDSLLLEGIDLTNFSALDFHIWFVGWGKIPGIAEIDLINQTLNYKQINADLYTFWKENQESMIKWMDGRITTVSTKAAKNKIICGNTEGWGPISWFDHPELDWKWVKESGDIGVELALKHDNYKFLCTSNFTHPQFQGMWEDVKWHRQITNKIKA
jgi:hypothetical protein